MNLSRLSVVLITGVFVITWTESFGWGQQYLPAYANMSTSQTQYGSLDGTWRVVWFEHQGESKPQLARDLQFVFSDQSLHLLQRARETITVTYKYDPQQTPATFEWFVERNGQTVTQRGICLQQESMLAICLGKVADQAPTDLTTGRRDGRTLFILTREELPSTSDADDSWLRLGVYELMPVGESNARLVVMLAVHRDGTIMGQSYAVGSEHQLAVRGTINKQTQQANWTDSEGAVNVRADMGGFAQAEATALVRFQNTADATWTMRNINAPLRLLSNALTAD